MRRPASPERLVILAGFAVFTAGIGHAVSYALVYSHPPKAAGAHGYFTVGLLVAAGLGAAAADAAFASGIRSGRSLSWFVAWPTCRSAGALAVGNSSLFVAQELLVAGLRNNWQAPGVAAVRRHGRGGIWDWFGVAVSAMARQGSVRAEVRRRPA